MISQAILAVTMLHGVRTYPFPQGGGITIPKPGADGGFEGDQFFQYINVPAADQFEWGYRRGNTEHNREQSLSQKAGGFKAKLRWHDGSDGHGEHYYDYNHGGAVQAYDPAPKPSYGQPRPNPPSKPSYGAPTLEIELAENRLSDFENLQPFQPLNN